MNEPEYTLSELYCAANDVAEDDDSIVKTVLRTGRWRYSPEPGTQRPIDKPINVIDGHSDDPSKAIGLGDIIDSFNQNAKDHVTVPLSHNNKVNENTGFIKDLFVDDDPDNPGNKLLKAKFNFTDPEIKEKVKNGSIANTSVGLFFDYIRKQDGKKFKTALDHVALTNSPWIDGMEPFGITASEETEVKEVQSLEFAEPQKEESEETGDTTPTDDEPKTGLSEDGSTETVETPEEPPKVKPKVYVLRAKEVKLSAEEELKQAQQRRELRLSQTKNKHTNKRGNSMSDSVLEGLELADDVRSELETALAEKQEADRLRTEIETLRRDNRSRKVDDRVAELKEIGFDSQPALLAYVRQVLLSDDEGTALLLSEDGEAGKKDSKLSAAEVVNGFIDRLPKTDGKINFGEQATNVLGDERPATDATNENKSAKEKADAARTWLYDSVES
jgi:hypothetical protein